MKDILVLLVLLYAQTIKVCSQPYKVEDGNCRNTTAEYLLGDLCCKKCPPGFRTAQKCTETTDTVCEPCPPGQYIENWNYAQNCFACTMCKPEKGLQYAQNCSSTTKSKCMCEAGRFCRVGHKPPYCSDCQKYKTCSPGQGVSVQGTATSNVKCQQCPKGTFSDTASSTDPCQPHTNCNGRAVLRNGTDTSDTVCEPHALTIHPHTIVLTTASTSTTADVPSSGSTAPLRLTAHSVWPSVSEEAFTSSTKSPPPTTEPYSKLAGVIASVTGFLVITITFILILLCLYKQIYKKGKDSARLPCKVDANGNCESADEKYFGKTQVTSLTATSQEHEHLLEKGEASSNHSQSTNNTETLTRTDGYSSHESIGPLQSTLLLSNPLSFLSEPMPLLSNTEPTVPQASTQTQISSQPNSPQVITPVTTSPHVNVNITLHIGNGSCGTPAFIPTDLMQADRKLPFGEEEESFSTPQQEAGKHSLMSVQESSSYCTEHTEQESYE